VATFGYYSLPYDIFLDEIEWSLIKAIPNDYRSVLDVFGFMTNGYPI